MPAEGLAFVAAEGKRVIGTARLWHIACSNGEPALLLGPVAIAADRRNRGIGAALVRRAIAAASRLGHRAIILIGDAPYYGRFGFSAEKAAAERMPGPFERHRLLALELVPGALDGTGGLCGRWTHDSAARPQPPPHNPGRMSWTPGGFRPASIPFALRRVI
jgi:predicted N-acetyltransferase YhbS